MNNNIIIIIHTSIPGYIIIIHTSIYYYYSYLSLRALLGCLLVLFENIHLLMSFSTGGVRPVLRSCSYLLWSKTLDIFCALWLLTQDSGKGKISHRVVKRQSRG